MPAMAMMALKSSYAVPQNVDSYRQQAVKSAAAAQQASNYASPTESNFSVRSGRSDGADDVANWDERRVGEWLKSIGAERYVALFRENNITGENLMDIDQDTLKEMGVKKIGDRVRIGSQAKQFRHRDYRLRRASQRDSFAALDHPSHTTSSKANSPRGQRARLQPSQDKPAYNSRANSRPTSPRYNDGKAGRGYLSPRENHQREQSGSYFGPASAKMVQTAKQTPQSGRFPIQTGRAQQSAVGNTTSIPSDKPWIRVIFDNGTSSIVSLDGATTYESILLLTLKKGNLDQKMLKSYCFHLLDGTEPNQAYTHRLDEKELLRVCSDKSRPERERLMVRKIHMGEPEDAQLYAAANIAQSQAAAAQTSNSRSQQKIQKMLGDSSITLGGPQLPAMSYPLSPNSQAERERHLSSAAKDLERSESKLQAAPRRRPRKEMKAWNGGRPPSELIVADTATWFPDADRAQIEKISRLSIRRSQRLSRATSRLSMMSNISVGSSIVMPGEGDVPALPAISDTFLKEGGLRARPLSIVRMGRPISSYRDSVASSLLSPLDEEGTLDESDRKSYVSFGADSGPESATVSITDPSGRTSSVHNYYDEASPISVVAGQGDDSSLNSQLAKALDEDGEEPDEELNEFLLNDSWDNIRYIRGKLIGQGSFGSVYLALHAFTAELMAVKQVELPSTAGTAIDAKKNTMVEALKREIALLRELKHPHIVQYLGSSSETENNTLNIFLEYIPGGSIAKMLVDFGSLSEDIVSKFVRQILVGLAYLHSQDIIHRDIKGANILVDNHGSVKISDFGISKRVQDSKTLLEEPAGAGAPGAKAKAKLNRVSLQGSVFWMAPEVVKQTAYTRKADIWSLGCLIVEMLTGSHPHPNCTQLQAIFKIGGRGVGGVPNDPSPDMPDKAGDKAREFLKATFRIDHEQRPEADELLNFAFVQAKKA